MRIWIYFYGFKILSSVYQSYFEIKRDEVNQNHFYKCIIGGNLSTLESYGMQISGFLVCMGWGFQIQQQQVQGQIEFIRKNVLWCVII